MEIFKNFESQDVNQIFLDYTRTEAYTGLA